MKIVFDLETTGFLDSEAIDYTASPYKLKTIAGSLKTIFNLHCAVVKDLNTGLIYKFTNPTDFKNWMLDNSHKFTHIIGHNIINFDLKALKLLFGIDFEITLAGSYFNGHKLEIFDTLVVSKTLNPDRFGGHSLDAWGKRLGTEKIDWRAEAVALGLIDAKAPKGAEFKTYHPNMLVYNERDMLVNEKLYFKLLEDMKGWDWTQAILLEHCVQYVITLQQHRGFKFDLDLAERNVAFLDAEMERIRNIVEPLIPSKGLPKTKLKEYTPPEKQFLQSGKPNAHIKNWIAKHEGTLTEEVNENGKYVAVVYGKSYELPIPCEPVITEAPAKLSSSAGDSGHIKSWLISLGWQPTEYKERDLTVNVKKQKLSKEAYEKAVDRYVNQTLNSNFCKDRCEHLDVKPGRLREFLLKKDIKRGVKVLTNPKIAVGQEKKVCPNLLKMEDKFPHSKLVTDYFTYSHRRNSILGGGADVDLDEDDWEEPESGYLSCLRLKEDGRIPTPADTCGASTSRFKHRLVANIPRVSSLFGEQMRAMFGVDELKFYQMGYDFASLEARIEAHYCWKYDSSENKAYCNSLIQDKPNDVHTITAKKISDIIGSNFSRQDAKSIKYACLPMHTRVLTKSGWKLFSDIEVNEELPTFNPTTGFIEWDRVKEKHYFEDKEVFKYSNKYDSFQCTEDHRWYGWSRKYIKGTDIRHKQYGFFDCKDITQEHNILMSAKSNLYATQNVSEAEASFIGWLLSDGYYKWSETEHRKRHCDGSISQLSKKYWRELEGSLEDVGCKYVKHISKDSNGIDFYTYKIQSKWLRDFMDRLFSVRLNKHDVNWTAWVLSISEEARECFYSAFFYGDGGMTRKAFGEEVVTQNKGNIHDSIVTAMLLSGKRISVKAKTEKCMTTRKHKISHLTCQELEKQNVGVMPTFCLTTGNGTFIIWQDSFVSITGNCTYGAGAKRIAKTIGSDLSTGEAVHQAFWDAALPLNLLIQKLTKYWETVGEKQFILGIDGRKVPTRAKSALANSLFQSAGVICAKMAMVKHVEKMKQHGLTVDFFKEDWQNKAFAQQLIAYHDEAQLEVAKSLVKFKKFSSEEEAKAFKKDNPNWSNIMETDKGIFVGYSLVGELMREAVKETSVHFKLNVALDADYDIGRNWAECH